MNSGGAQLFQLLTTIALIVIPCIAVWRLIRAYGSSDDGGGGGGAVGGGGGKGIETKAKNYFMMVVEAGIVEVLILAVKVIIAMVVGTFSGFFSGYGSF